MMLTFVCEKHQMKYTSIQGCVMCNAEGKRLLQEITAQEADALVREKQIKDTNPKDALADNRIPLWLLSPIAKAHWAMAQLAGLIKYGAWNWRAAGVRRSVYISAAQRHLDAYLSGERCDPVDGTHHLGNVMACCGILLDAEAAGKVVEDRPPRVDHRPTYAECELLIPKLREKYKDRDPRHYTLDDPKC